MKFKKEFGISEILAVVALLISVVALIQSHRASNPYLVLGVDDLRTMAYHNGDTCNMLLSFSVEFNNSGQRGATLQRMAAPNNNPPVMFVLEGQIVDKKKRPYEIFFLPGRIENLDIYWNTLRKRFKPLDLQRPSFIQRIVSPNSSEKLFFAVDAPMSAPSPPREDKMLIAFDLDDNKGNRHEVRMALDTSDFPFNDCQ